MRYEINLYWSEQDQSFIAEVPDLPGCAADGETYQKALIPEPTQRLMSA